MTRPITFAPGEFYHLYNRGTEKRQIFMDERDYDRFLALLYLCNGAAPAHLQLQGRTLKEVLSDPPDRGNGLVEIGAYCLMPNHFHLIVRERLENGVSKFMQKLGNGFTGYFNTRYERTGALFQGRFKAQHADTDRYLSYLVSYVHLNPIKLIQPDWKEARVRDTKQAEKYLRNFRYSSYPDYLGKERLENIIVNKESLPVYHQSPTDISLEMKEWLEYRQSIKVGP